MAGDARPVGAAAAIVEDADGGRVFVHGNLAYARRWETRLADAGMAGLLVEAKGPKRESKLTADTVVAIRRLREDGVSNRGIAADMRVSQGSVRNVLVLAGGGTRTGEACQQRLPILRPSPSPSPSPSQNPSPSPSQNPKRGRGPGRRWMRAGLSGSDFR